MCAGVSGHCLEVCSFIAEREFLSKNLWNNIVTFLTMTICSFNMEEYARKGEKLAAHFILNNYRCNIFYRSVSECCKDNKVYGSNSFKKNACFYSLINTRIMLKVYLMQSYFCIIFFLIRVDIQIYPMFCVIFCTDFFR